MGKGKSLRNKNGFPFQKIEMREKQGKKIRKNVFLLVKARRSIKKRSEKRGTEKQP